MNLNSIYYIENKGSLTEWQIENTLFSQINVIAGSNSTGKSRFLNAITTLIKLLSNTIDASFVKHCCEWHLFLDSYNNKRTEYILKINKGTVIEEKLTIVAKNTEPLLSRDERGVCNVFATNLNKTINFGLRLNELGAVKCRDSVQHLFLNDLYQWSSAACFLEAERFIGSDINRISRNDKFIAKSVFILAKNRFGEDFIKSVIDDMIDVDYYLSEIGIKISSCNYTGIDPTDCSIIYIKESDSDYKIEQPQIAKKMFYVLELIILLNYFLLAGTPLCILIDNFGDGLDYQRASLLMKLIVRKIENSSIRFVASTHNHNVIDNTPIEYLSFVGNNPKTFKLNNIHNSQAKFEEIKLIGFNHSDWLVETFWDSPQ